MDAAADLVDAIRPMARSTARAGAMGEIGGFGGLFDLKAAGFDDPVLVAATDGVGTKLKIAIDSGTHRTIGIDLVAMCANDIVVQGAEPLFFLDYFATGRLERAVAEDVLAGIVEGCKAAGCALIGGETAEMPGFYGAGDYDLAGFAVGAAERGNLLSGATVREGCTVLGLASRGVHANGYSLVRRIVADAKLAYDDRAPFSMASLAEELLRPTRIYVRSTLAAHRAGLVRALAHITGGGLIDNIARVLPDGLAVEIDPAAWPLPDMFAWLAEAGPVPPVELARTFNCGIGMAAIVDPGDSDEVRRILVSAGEQVWPIGAVVPRTPDLPAVHLSDNGAAWRG